MRRLSMWKWGWSTESACLWMSFTEEWHTLVTGKIRWQNLLQQQEYNQDKSFSIDNFLIIIPVRYWFFSLFSPATELPVQYTANILHLWQEELIHAHMTSNYKEGTENPSYKEVHGHFHTWWMVLCSHTKIWAWGGREGGQLPLYTNAGIWRDGGRYHIMIHGYS